MFYDILLDKYRIEVDYNVARIRELGHSHYSVELNTFNVFDEEAEVSLDDLSEDDKSIITEYVNDFLDSSKPVEAYLDVLEGRTYDDHE